MHSVKVQLQLQKQSEQNSGQLGGSISRGSAASSGQSRPWLDVADLQLDPASSYPDLPLADGHVRFGPILVLPGSGSREGRYSLRVSVAGASKLGLAPFRVPFDMVNASATSLAFQEALDKTNSANARVKELDKQLKRGKKGVEQQEQALEQKLLETSRLLPEDLRGQTQNPGAVLQACQQRLASLPEARQARHPQQLTQELRQRLLAIPGVVGFLVDLVLVSDDDDARLLSFAARSKLSTLVVRDWQARLAVRAHLSNSRAKPPWILPLTQASALPQLALPPAG